jgi:hypothetical protein
MALTLRTAPAVSRRPDGGRARRGTYGVTQACLPRRMSTVRREASRGPRPQAGRTNAVGLNVFNCFQLDH